MKVTMCCHQSISKNNRTRYELLRQYATLLSFEMTAFELYITVIGQQERQDNDCLATLERYIVLETQSSPDHHKRRFES